MSNKQNFPSPNCPVPADENFFFFPVETTVNLLFIAFFYLKNSVSQREIIRYTIFIPNGEKYRLFKATRSAATKKKLNFTVNFYPSGFFDITGNSDESEIYDLHVNTYSFSRQIWSR